MSYSMVIYVASEKPVDCSFVNRKMPNLATDFMVIYNLINVG